MAVFFLSNSFIMKKWICMFAVSLSASCSLAQPFAIYVESNCSQVNGNSIDLSGETYSTTINAGEMGVVNFYLKNNSGSSRFVVIKRTRVCVPAEWSDGLCWGNVCQVEPGFEGGCYTDAQMVTNPWISPGVTVENDSLAELKSDVFVAGISEGGLYRYYFLEGNNVLDSVDLKINNDCSLGIGEQGQEVGMSVFPNPVDNELTVSTFGVSGNPSLYITDVSGKVVYESRGTNLQIIQMSAFQSGVYFISMLENGVVLTTNRVLVNH